MSNQTLFHAAIFVVAFAVFYVLFLRSARLKARFRLYEVRDRLILLVAQDKLEEDNPVFVHCYSRVNQLLQETRHVGLDDLLHVILSPESFSDFDRVLARARARMMRLSEDKSLERAEVRAVVRDYLSAIEFIIITHSSWMRVFWLVSAVFTWRVARQLAAAIAPQPARRAMASVQVFEEAGAQLVA